MRSSGIWVVVALVVGLGVGYGLGSGPLAGDPSEREAVDALDAVAAPTATPKAAPPQAAPPRDDLLSEGDASKTTAASEPTLEGTEGSGTIRGRVVDMAGAPITGVQIIAVPTALGTISPQRPDGSAPAERTLEEKLAKAARNVHITHAGRREARTDGSGRYEIQGLADRAYRLQSYREGYVLKPARGSTPWRVKPGAVVDYEGEVVVLVYVDVLGPDGTPPKSASVQTSTDEAGREGRRGFGWSPERNWIRIAPGTRWLSATAGEQRDLKAPRQQFSAAAGAASLRLTVQLVGRPGIRGQVTFPEALSEMRFQMIALKFTGDTAPEASAVLQSRQAARVRYDRQDHDYSVQDIEAGRYLLVASYDGQHADLARVVEVKDAMVELDLEMPPVDRTHYRLVRVIGEDGEPIVGVDFSLDIRGPTMSGSAGAPSLRRADGSYYVALHGGGSMPTPGADSTVWLRVSTRQRGAVEQVVDPKATSELLIQLGEPATVDLTIAGFVDSGLTGKVIVYVKSSLKQHGMGFRGEGAPVTTEGRVHIANQQSGERIAVLVAGSGHGVIQVIAWTLRLKAGENRPTVRLPRLYEVRVEGAARSVSLRRLDPPGPYMQQYGRSDAEGRFLLPFVPPGRYEASVYLGEGKTKTMPFDVPAQTVIRFD